MGRAPRRTKDGLSRGQWTAEEDELLVRSVQAHGKGRWRSLAKKAGLLRCGKSCRLRWKNYLQPDIKRGNISSDEEELIIRLHSLLGNRWALIAGRLPGRTDNEIKNYWNTHLSTKHKSKVIDQKHPKGASKRRKNTKQDSDGETKTRIKVYQPQAVKVSPFLTSVLPGYGDQNAGVDQLVVSNGPWYSSDLNDAQNGVEANLGVSPFPTSMLPGYGDWNVGVDQLVVSNGLWSSSDLNNGQNGIETNLGVSPFPTSVLPGYGDGNVGVDQLVVSNGPWSSSDLKNAQNGVEANLGVSPFPTSVLPGYGDWNVEVDRLVVSNGHWSSFDLNDAQNGVEKNLGVAPFPTSVLPSYGDRNVGVDRLVVFNGSWSSSDLNDNQNGVEAYLGVNEYDGYVPLQNSKQKHDDKVEKIYEEIQQILMAED